MKMETEREKENDQSGEIEEINVPESSNPNPSPKPKSKSVKTKVPEIQIHVYKQGKGPIDSLKTALGGWDQDQLEVHDILDKYGFKTIFAFNTDSGRGVPIRFNPRNGRSVLTYSDGAVISIDGEPKDSMIKPITKILFGVAIITLLIAFVVKEEGPEWFKKLNIFGGNFPPWILACIVIVFTRMRKRTRDFFRRFGW